jgi:hypothetical protein
VTERYGPRGGQQRDVRDGTYFWMAVGTRTGQRRDNFEYGK